MTCAISAWCWDEEGDIVYAECRSAVFRLHRKHPGRSPDFSDPGSTGAFRRSSGLFRALPWLIRAIPWVDRVIWWVLRHIPWVILWLVPVSTGIIRVYNPWLDRVSSGEVWLLCTKWPKSAGPPHPGYLVRGRPAPDPGKYDCGLTNVPANTIRSHGWPIISRASTPVEYRMWLALCLPHPLEEEGRDPFRSILFGLLRSPFWRKKTETVNYFVDIWHSDITIELMEDFARRNLYVCTLCTQIIFTYLIHV